MLALSAPVVAAAYLLLGQPGHTGRPVPVAPPLPPPCANHISVRWVGEAQHHHRHCHRWRHGWRCR
jgi:hypothetical protein